MTDLQYLGMLLACSLFAWAGVKNVRYLMDLRLRRLKLELACQKVTAYPMARADQRCGEYQPMQESSNG